MSDEETTDQVTVSEELRSVSFTPPEAERHARIDTGLPTIPGYEVLSELGRGGMGVVYLARQISLNRRVALKMIRSGELASEHERDRFLTEAEAIARLQHPGIVQVYEIGTFNGCPFFALEYVEGGSLAAYLAGEPQPAREAAAFMAELARAMQHAHERGIIHRDLKPANVLLVSREGKSPAGEGAGDSRPRLAKIADFGLARLTDTDCGATATGAILGTPSYASPEQASGHAREAAAPADIHALGVILYEMLTGRPPFKAATALETLEMVRTQEPVSPRQLMPSIPRDLDTICLKCLYKNPARRYASASELAADLDRYLKGEPIRARPVGKIERAIKWAQRRPALAALILVCLVAVGVGAFGVWTYHRDLGDALQESRRETQKKEQALDRATHSLYASQLANVDKVWQNDPRQALELLDDQERCPEALRDFVWGYYHRHSRRQVWSTRGHKREVSGVAFSANGGLLYGGGSDGVRIWDASTGKPQGELDGPCDNITCLAISPDGRTLAAGGLQRKIILWDTATRKQKRTLIQEERYLLSLAFSPDSRHLAATGVNGSFRVWDLTTGTSQKPLDEEKLGPMPVAWSPDSKWLVLGVKGHKLLLLSTTSAHQEETAAAHKWTVGSVQFSPDGKVLASVDIPSSTHDTSTVRLWRPDAALRWQPGPPIVVRTGYFNALAFSPDSSTLAVAGNDNAVRLVDVLSNRERLILRGQADRVRSVAFSPGGRLLAAGCINGTIHVWNAQGGRDRDPLIREGLYYSAAAFSPDGNELVVAGDSVVVGQRERTSVIRHEWPSGNPRRLLASVGMIFDLAWSPDGETLACAHIGDVLLYPRGQAPPEKWTPGRGRVTRVAFSADSHRLAACTDRGLVAIRNNRSGTLTRLEGGSEKMRWSGLSFSPDGKTLAASGFILNEPGEIVLWDVETGAIRCTMRGHASDVPRVLFSPDGDTIASAGSQPDNSVRLWNVDGTLRTVLPRHAAGISALAFDPTGRVLASASLDGQIKLWDPKYGQERLTLVGHLDQVRALAFHPKKPMLISVSWDKTLRVWEGDEFLVGQ
jgi:WD40 repeat protein/tRNA A-37 threonylcarbamoyl transferase component Bud32